jgi:hypothetical protein
MYKRDCLPFLPGKDKKSGGKTTASPLNFEASKALEQGPIKLEFLEEALVA